MNNFSTYVDGVSLWAPELPGWEHARAAFLDEAAGVIAPHRLPAPAMLSPAERRRAPATVALALAAADEAIRASGQAASHLLSVFTSTYGDLPIIDHLCSTLVHAPLLMSPTRFLHSVHNAPAGFWSMLSRNTQAHTAICGASHSFAAGLLEAAVLSETEQKPVLLVGYDIGATGALKYTARSHGALSVALILNPRSTAKTQMQLEWTLNQGRIEQPTPRSAAAHQLAPNAMASALPLFEALARGESDAITLPVSHHQSLRIHLRPMVQLRSYRPSAVPAAETPGP